MVLKNSNTLNYPILFWNIAIFSDSIQILQALGQAISLFLRFYVQKQNIQLKIIIQERFAPIVPQKTIFPNFHWKKRGLLLLLRILAMKQICCQILLNSSKMKVGFEIWHISDFTRLIIPLTKHKGCLLDFLSKKYLRQISISGMYQRVKTQKK